MAFTLMRGLVAQGHDVIPLDWCHNPLAAGVAGRCEVLALPRPASLAWARTARWHFSLLRRLPRLKVDHDVLLNPTGYPNVRGHHPRLALVVHDLHMLRPGFYRACKSSWFRLFYRRGLLGARVLICVSHNTRSELLRRYPVDPARCVVVHNSLDPSFVADVADSQDADVPAGDPYLLVVGAIEERKNVLRLAEAFARCREAGLAQKLVVAGRIGHGGDAFLRRIRAPDLAGAVEVLGGVGDQALCRLYRGAMALVFPSLEEGFGLPILEAMHLGTPVLTSEVSATAEVAGDAALLVDPTDTDSIREGIMRLARDRSLRAELSRRGRARVLQFDAKTQARAYADHLATVAGAARPASASASGRDVASAVSR